VATLPGRGIYARHLGHPEGVDSVHRVTVPATPTSSRPPGSFERSWLESHLDGVDVVHVHALPTRSSPAEITAAARTVRQAGKPLVLTAYHLSDPTGTDDGRYREQLQALLPFTDAVITLTPSAAGEMRSRWGVDPIVLPHPHAVDFVRMRMPRPRWRNGEFTVGVHLGSLHGPYDPVRLVGALATAVDRVPEARLVIHLHSSVLDPGSSNYDPVTAQRLDRTARSVGGVIRTHRPLGEAQLWDHLFALDVSVMPGIHGSHSVWPEACHDLGTNVVMPAGCHASGQRPCLVYDTEGETPEVNSLAAALVAAREQGIAWRADPAERWKERVHISETLRAVYDRLRG
jgi:hypothetical protein